MATITPRKSDDNKKIVWKDVTENDTADPVLIASGRHTVEVNGTFGSATCDIQGGNTSNDLVDLDTTGAPIGLRFTDQGMANLEIAGGYIAPEFSGGSSQSLTVTITKID